MTNDKGHVSVDEINLQKKVLQNNIEAAIKAYCAQTGLTPDITVNRCSSMQTGYGKYMSEWLEVSITQPL